LTNEKKAIRAIYWSIASSALLALIKGFSGYYGHSYALVADAIESTTDIFAAVLVLAGLIYASKPADKNHPYGHGRIEPLITFLVVGFLMISAAIIAWKSIQNIRTPHQLPESWTLLVLGAIIVWKEVSYRIMLRKGQETHSSSLKADAWHHRSDAITSVAAFIGISVALLLGPGYEMADDWAALLASGFILYNCFLIFRPALGEIMDEHVYDDLIEDIRKVAVDIPGIEGTEKCFIRKTGMKYLVELHALVDGDVSVTEGHRLAHLLQEELIETLPQIGHVLVHVEPLDEHD